MDTNLTLNSLKLKLSSLGAIRPQAWIKIMYAVNETGLKVDESFNREIGSVAFVVNGLLKEYDPYLRKKPSIINFISAGNFFVTTKFNQKRYLKAITETTILYLNFHDLTSLYLRYNELKSVYDSIVASYEEETSFRHLMLEEKLAPVRIQNFIIKYRTILSQIKKKDVANYTHLEYEYFIRIYGKLL